MSRSVFSEPIMMRRFFLVASALLAAPFALAEQLYNVETMELFRKLPQQQAFLDMLSGKSAPTNAKLLDLAAEFYVYRATWADLQNGAVKRGADTFTMHDYIDEFDKQMSKVAGSKNQAFIDAFAPRLVKKFEDIVKLDFNNEFDRRSILYGVQLFPALGRLPHESVGRFFYETMTDSKKHDVLKLWAIKGLYEQFPLVPIDDGNWKEPKHEARRANDARRVDELVKFIFRPKPENLDERAYVYLRREAIQTLANTRVPAVSLVKAIGKEEGPVAPTLIRILSRKHDMTPPPTFAEKLEAAIGLLDMRYNPQRYDPNPGLYAAGQFLLEMVGKYQEDQPNLKSPPTPGALKKPAITPWKLQGARLERIVQESTRGSMDAKFPPPMNPATPLSKALIGAKDAPLLESIAKAMKNYDALGQHAASLRSVVGAWKEPAPNVFLNLK
jgi:hypothetical protein